MELALALRFAKQQKTHENIKENAQCAFLTHFNDDFASKRVFVSPAVALHGSHLAMAQQNRFAAFLPLLDQERV